ncbi:UNVERIFIED_CONTAM: hypothetical protein ABIC26_003591 [Paenibacillus sp. PvR008]
MANMFELDVQVIDETVSTDAWEFTVSCLFCTMVNCDTIYTQM